MRPPRRRPSSNIDVPPAAEILPLHHTIGEDVPYAAPCRTKSSDDLNLVLEWTDDLADSMDHLELQGGDGDEDVSVGSFYSQTTNTETTAARPSLRSTESGMSLYSIGGRPGLMPTASDMSVGRGVLPADSGMMSFCSMGSLTDRFHVVSPETSSSTAVVLMDCEEDHNHNQDERPLMAPCLSDLPFRSNDKDDDNEDDDDDEPIQLASQTAPVTPAREVSREGCSKPPIMFGQSKHKPSIYRAPSMEQQ